MQNGISDQETGRSGGLRGVLMETLTTVIASGDGSLRRRLRSRIDHSFGIRIVGEAESHTSIAHCSRDLRPTILLLDTNLLTGPDDPLLPSLLSVSPATQVLLLFDSLNPELLLQALAKGVHGGLLKTASARVFTKAIHVVHGGDLWVTRRLLAELVFRLKSAAAYEASSHDNVITRLTDREREIVHWLGLGKMNKEIGRHLGISDLTVKTHLQHIFRKCHVSRRADLIVHPVSALGPGSGDATILSNTSLLDAPAVNAMPNHELSHEHAPRFAAPAFK